MDFIDAPSWASDLSLSLEEQHASRVAELLDPGVLPVLRKMRIPGLPALTLSPERFLQLLFSRTAAEVLEQLSSEQLAGIGSACLAALDQFDAKSPALVQSGLRDGTPFFLLVAQDRPFIVSSIAEALRDFRVSAHLFIHPVLLLADQTVALSYLVTGECSSARRTQLETHLKATLQILTDVVDDFSPMVDQVSAVAKRLASVEAEASREEPEFDPNESSDFLNWLSNGCFFFIGVGEWQLDANDLRPRRTLHLGGWRSAWSSLPSLEEEVLADVTAHSKSRPWVRIAKVRLSSPVHRRSSLIHITVADPSNSKRIYSIVGHLTSRAVASEADDIPIVRFKLSNILCRENVIPNSHDYKYIFDIVDNMPVSEVLTLSTDQLRSVVHLALGVFQGSSSRTKTLVTSGGRRATVVVIVPTERFSSSLATKIGSVIENSFGSDQMATEISIDSSKRRQQRLYVSVPILHEIPSAGDLRHMEDRIISATRSWSEAAVEYAVERGVSKSIATWILRLPEDFQNIFAPEDGLRGAEGLSNLNEKRPIVAFLERNSIGEVFLSLFSLGQQLTISQAVPVLENIGITVIGAWSFDLDDYNRSILKLLVRASDGAALDDERFERVVGPGIESVLGGMFENDSLNSLMRSIGVNVASIALLRTYCALFWQVNKVAARRTIYESLASNPSAAAALWDYFKLKFEVRMPLSINDRVLQALQLETQFFEFLRKVTDITQDRILRGLFSLFKHTVRTNYFSGADTVVVKLRSTEIDIMPQPRPMFELFVHGPRIEGTHLRSGPIARGGIRWSERPEDYRSEVLGLMKTQKIKNAIIVPGGAKGGFILRSFPKEPELAPAAVEAGYREYIRTLLTVADNRVDDTVVHPEGVICYDGPDPYFVVAADKGTASFSDVANQLAVEEYDFWLGDAFASGGSRGYDHKKYGITARGAWECIKRHFHDLAIPYETDTFTVIGLGDMSGDVFGNGLLLSTRMSLIAAFNHQHLFLDPEPDFERSFAERKRLFEKSRSKWTDYNPEIISQGGGIFGRFEKEIRITPQIRAVLALDPEFPDLVDGERLISAILRAPADLMYNGGIGTYVKASSESNAEVNDGTNDGVRVNANELRVRVVGEGGNLGFTQAARIEFSESGGRTNTDAIDNSGGVDLSDHEVNLKLLLSPFVKNGALTREARDTLLRSVDEEVVGAVLEHNRDQALMLTVSAATSSSRIDEYQALIRDLHKNGYLNRTLDGLPEDEELGRRALNKQGLWRPELAVCSAATKLWLKDQLRESQLVREPLLDQILLGYFPAAVLAGYRSAVMAHPLRNDIIATEIVNSLLPVVGISFPHHAISSQGASPVAILKCILSAELILGTLDLRGRLRTLDVVGHSDGFVQLWLDMGTALRNATRWLWAHHSDQVGLAQLIDLYRAPFATLVEHADQIFVGDEGIRYERRVAQYQERGASIEVARNLSVFRRLLPVLEVLWSSREFSTDVRLVARVYSLVLEIVGLNVIFKMESTIDVSNRWEQDVVNSSYQEMRRSVSLICGRLIGDDRHDPAAVRQKLSSLPGYGPLVETLGEIEDHVRAKRPFKVAALTVVARQLRSLAEAAGQRGR